MKWLLYSNCQDHHQASSLSRSSGTIGHGFSALMSMMTLGFINLWLKVTHPPLTHRRRHFHQPLSQSFSRCPILITWLILWLTRSTLEVRVPKTPSFSASTLTGRTKTIYLRVPPVSTMWSLTRKLTCSTAPFYPSSHSKQVKLQLKTPRPFYRFKLSMEMVCRPKQLQHSLIQI